ncbi:MAG: hypothetical protein LBK99_11790 [Opitutaceae bacterium]|nr:hypothetical protein [Opitutaceae bacterium]
MAPNQSERIGPPGANRRDATSARISGDDGNGPASGHLPAAATAAPGLVAGVAGAAGGTSIPSTESTACMASSLARQSKKCPARFPVRATARPGSHGYATKWCGSSVQSPGNPPANPANPANSANPGAPPVTGSGRRRQTVEPSRLSTMTNTFRILWYGSFSGIAGTNPERLIRHSSST